MILEKNEYKLGKWIRLCGDKTKEEYISISKSALERLKEHYSNIAKGYREQLVFWSLYTSKADLLTELLDLFEDAKEE